MTFVTSLSPSFVLLFVQNLIVLMTFSSSVVMSELLNKQQLTRVVLWFRFDFSVMYVAL